MRLNERSIFLLSGVAIFLLFLFPVQSDDLFMCLALGRRLFTLGEFGATDPYLFTIQNYQWHLWHEWLSYLVYFGLFTAFGMTGLVVLKAALVVAATTLVWRGGTRAGVPALLVMLISVVALGIALPRIGDRASFFSDLMTCLLIYIFSGANATRARRWLPGLFLVWVQLHPAFPVGLLLVFLFIAANWNGWTQSERQAWAWTGVLCVAATLVNPLGLEGLIYPLRKFVAPEWQIFREINSEWQSSWTSSHLNVIYKICLSLFLSVVLLSALVQIRRRGWFPLAVAVTLTYLSLSAVRFLALGGFGGGLLLVAACTQQHWNWHRWKTRGARALALALPLAGIVWAFANTNSGPTALWRGQVISPAIPVNAARKFGELGAGNIFNEYNLGGLLVWELDGRMKIAAHGHIDSPALVRSNILRFSNTREDFEELVIERDVQYFFVHRETIDSQPLAGFVRELRGPRWQVAYQDDLAIIFARNRTLGR